jgi:hypothetical protein
VNLFDRVIRHKRFMDVCVLVTKSFDVGHKLKVKGKWVNMAYVRSYELGVNAKFDVAKSDLKDWEYCVSPEGKECLRYAEWKPIKG